MPVSNAWNEATPADPDALSQGAAAIRTFKIDVRQRMQQGGVLWLDSLSTDGLHAVNAGGAGVGPDIYKSDKATKLVTWADTGATMVAGATWIGGNVTSGTDPGHVHTGTVALRVSGAVSVGKIKASFRAPRNLTFVNMSIVVFTAPGGNTLRVQALLLSAPTTATDRNTAANSIFSPTSNAPTIAVGAFSASSNTFNTLTMNSGDEIVFSIDNTGAWSPTPADLSIQLDVR